MPFARNDAGETLYLDDGGEWKPAPTAINPETKETLAFDGKSWSPLTPRSQPANQPSLPPTSASDAFGRGFTSAGSFGFRDEGSGLIAAGGGDPDNPDPAHALSSLAVGTYRRLIGDPEAEQRYNTEVDRQRTQARQLEEEHPGASIGGQVVGALAMPLPALRAATVGGRAAQAAGIGAATGALTGFGEGEETFSDRIRKMIYGGAIGGVAGGVVAPVAEGALAAGRYALARPVGTAMSALFPERAAERAVGRSYMEATRADPAAVNRLAPSELTPGNEAVVMDVLGQPGRNLARSSANLSGEARDVLEGTLDPRFAGQSQRFTDWFRQHLHFGDNTHDIQEAIDAAERTTNAKNYKLAIAQGDVPLWSFELDRLTSAPPLQRALRAAAESGQTRAVTSGMGGFHSPITVTPDGRIAFNRGPGGVPTYPNLEFWDAARRELSDAARAAGRAGRKTEADQLGDLARALNTELDTLVPTYQQARQGAAAFFGEENALRAGAKFVDQDFNIAQTRAALGKMSESERKLFEDGFTFRMVEKLNAMSERSDITRRIWSNPAKREQIELVLGAARARNLEAMMRVESIMREANRGVSGNSTTAQQVINAGLAGGAAYYYGGDVQGAGLASALTAFGTRKIDQRVAAKVAQMLTSADAKIVDRGVKMLANSDRMMGALREADAALARIAGTQTGRRAP